jgi:hypothetical protein
MGLLTISEDEEFVECAQGRTDPVEAIREMAADIA